MVDHLTVRDRYARLFFDLPVPTFVISPAGMILEANRAAARIAKSSPSALEGQSLESWISSRSKVIWWTFLQRLNASDCDQRLFCEVQALGLVAETGDGAGFFRLDGSRDESGSELTISLTDVTSARSGEQSARLGHWHWNATNNVVTWSDEIYRMYAADPTTYIPSYDKLANLYSPESFAKLNSAVEQALKNRVSYELDLETPCLDGAVKWILARGEPLLSVDGAVIGLYGTVQDITERKTLEAVLHQRQQIWHQAEEIGQIGAWERDLASGRMIASEGYARLMGSSNCEMNFEEWLDVVHPDDKGRVLENIRTAMSTGSMSLEYRIFRPDGEQRVLFAQTRSMKDESGGPVRSFGVVQDITGRKELEAALTKRRQMWIEAEKIGRLGGWDLDIATGRFAFSDGLAAILGCQRRPYPLEQVIHLVHPGDIEAFRMGIHDTTVLGKSFDLELRIFRENDGVERVVLAQSRAVLDDSGKPVRSFGAVQDITERKRSERALEQTMQELTAAKAKADEALRAKGLFLAAMSHEIRTPLNSVIGLSNLLSDSELDAQQRDFIETIRTSGELLLAVVNDILDYSKLEEGKVQAERIPFDLRGAANEAIRVVSQTAIGKGLELRLEFADNGCAGWVVGDPGRLKQVLLNLLSNAVKFTARGSITLRVDSLGKDEDEVRFQVIDTGIGIPAGSQKALFEFFTQADSSTTRRFGGTGLGLAISRRLVHLLGGAIGVRSEANVGSTFWFTAKLPATLSNTSPQAQPGGRLPAQFVGKRALVVDSDTGSSAHLAGQLERLRLRACSAASAKDALSAMDASIASGDPIEFLFLDSMISGGGWKLADTIRQRPRGREIAIFVIATERSKSHRLKKGKDSKRPAPDGFLLKPVPDLILAQAISRLSSNSERPLAARGIEPERRRVLVVEDNRVNQKVAAASLERLGCQVDIAQNGNEAVSFYESTIAENAQNVYDIILMDCHMPGMDGFEATMEIRKLEAALTSNRRRIPILALSADVLESGLQRCIQSGMDDFLSKPIRLSELDAAFRRWIPDKPPLAYSLPLRSRFSSDRDQDSPDCDQDSPLMAIRILL